MRSLVAYLVLLSGSTLSCCALVSAGPPADLSCAILPYPWSDQSNIIWHPPFPKLQSIGFFFSCAWAGKDRASIEPLDLTPLSKIPHKEACRKSIELILHLDFGDGKEEFAGCSLDRGLLGEPSHRDDQLSFSALSDLRWHANPSPNPRYLLFLLACALGPRKLLLAVASPKPAISN